MSYYFEMAFAEVRNKSAAYDICQKAVNALTQKAAAEEFIRNSYPFFQTRCAFEKIEPTDFLRDMWLQCIFQVRFVYWQSLGLLALCGDNYPKAVTDFFGPAIGFQNSTDQNYPFDAWDSDVAVFQDTISQISKIDVDFLRVLLGYGKDEKIDEEYARRWAVYKTIFERLELNDWLYGRSGHFERIRMSGLTTSEKTLKVQTWAHVVTSKL